MSQALQTIPHSPRVFEIDGELYTTSRIVADEFTKDHSKVLRDIRTLSCSPEFRAANFGFTFDNKQIGNVVRDEQTMIIARDGFLFLAMGYRGAKAGSIRERLLGEFRAMEQELKDLRARPATIDLDDPAYMIALSSSLFAKNQELQAWKQAAKPAVEFAERVSASSATYCLTDACKLLELKPKAGIQAMSDAGLIYRRTPGAPWVASQAALDKKWFKPVIIERDSFTGSQTRVTGAGLVAIAGKIGSTLTQLEIHNRLTALSRQPDLLTAA